MGCGSSNNSTVRLSAEEKKTLNAQRDICRECWKLMLEGKYEGFKTLHEKNKSWSVGTAFYNIFYEELYKVSPRTEAYFQSHSILTQARSLMRMIASSLEIDGSPQSKLTLEELAKAHAIYLGVGPEHYKPTMEALLISFERLMQDIFTTRYKEAWQAVFAHANKTMIPISKVHSKPVVVIVGSGYGGADLAKQLDELKQFTVLLVSRTDYLLHNIGLPGAVVDPNLVKRCLIPLTNLMPNGGQVLHGEVTEIRPPYTIDQDTKERKNLVPGIVIAGRSAAVRYDYLVIATGSSYAFPSKIPHAIHENVRKSYEPFANEFKNNPKLSCILVGGGAVSVEIAGELITAYPEASITIVHRHEKVLNHHIDDLLRDKIHDELQNMGVKFVHGSGIKSEKMLREERNNLNLYWKNEILILEDGQELPADLIIFCTGCLTNTASLLKNMTHVLEHDRLKVAPNLLVEGYDNVFAIGDICNADPRKLAKVAMSQSPLITANIVSLAARTSEQVQAKYIPEDLKTYEASYAFMTISMGPKNGAGIVDGKLVPKDEGFVAMKSKDYASQLFWDKFGNNINDIDNAEFHVTDMQNKDEDVKVLMATMHVTELAARKLLQKGLSYVEKTGLDVRT